MKRDAFGSRRSFDTGRGTAVLYGLDALAAAGLSPGLDRMPFSIKVLLEAVLRNVDGELVTEDDVRNLAAWNAAAPRDVELPYMPARVILQDFTGVPAVVDLADNGACLFAPRSRVYLREGTPPRRIAVATRVGISKAADRPLRFYDADSPAVSSARESR